MSDCMTQEDAMNMNNEQAIQILKPMHDRMLDMHGCPIGDVYFALGKAIDALRKIPSAERTGRWTHAYDENEKLFFRNKWVCSACGKSNTYGMSDFCPCCGAMMENSTRLMKEAEKIKCLM